MAEEHNMANRIQLRRDHSTNWTRINPVLSDGEPGLEIDTNKVKYGDGTTAWRDLRYAGPGFQYARIQEGDSFGHPVTSITGIPGDVLSITSDNFAQLMWVPDTNTITLDDINVGPANFSWVFVDDKGFTVENKQPGSDFVWGFGFDGTTQFPHYTFPAADGSANQVLATNGNGTLSWTTMSGSGTANGWQLTSSTYVVNLDGDTGVLTVPGFMNLTYGQGGADTMNFGTGPGGGSVNATAGKNIYVTTNGGSGQWVFGNDGVLALSTSSTILGNNADPNVYIETVNGDTTSTWTFGTDGVLTLPGAINNSTKTTTGSGDPAYPTAIDLTKTVNKLADNLGSTYTLADGHEGQIMYLVPQTGATMTGVNVTVNHARIIDNSTSTALVVTDALLAPFNCSATPVPTMGVTTLIFTDSAWQADAGVWTY